MHTVQYGKGQCWTTPTRLRSTINDILYHEGDCMEACPLAIHVQHHNNYTGNRVGEGLQVAT